MNKTVGKRCRGFNKYMSAPGKQQLQLLPWLQPPTLKTRKMGASVTLNEYTLWWSENEKKKLDGWLEHTLLCLVFLLPSLIQTLSVHSLNNMTSLKKDPSTVMSSIVWCACRSFELAYLCHMPFKLLFHSLTCIFELNLDIEEALTRINTIVSV